MQPVSSVVERDLGTALPPGFAMPKSSWPVSAEYLQFCPLTQPASFRFVGRGFEFKEKLPGRASVDFRVFLLEPRSC